MASAMAEPDELDDVRAASGAPHRVLTAARRRGRPFGHGREASDHCCVDVGSGRKMRMSANETEKRRRRMLRAF